MEPRAALAEYDDLNDSILYTLPLRVSPDKTCPGSIHVSDT